MATSYTLTDETPTAAINVKGTESFIFVSGSFGGGEMVTQFSPDGLTWFDDRQLTFLAKDFETFRAAPVIRYRFKMQNTTSTPNVVVQVA